MDYKFFQKVIVLILSSLLFVSCFKDVKPEGTYLVTDVGDNGVDNIVDNIEESGTINSHAYVDLGLPSGLKWATCNVGAETPEDYGDYYAWGETSTKSEYTSENSLTYGKSMSDISGNITYDVARKKWGSSWRLPTMKELKELSSKCEWWWTTINGKKVAKVIGPNGNSIFLPAAGWHDGSLLRGAGENCEYWSSTPLESDAEGACVLEVKNSARVFYWGYRFYGQSVRPVSE